MQLTPHTITDTQKRAEDVAQSLSAHDRTSATVLGLHGDLGAGKTTFMQFFGQALGVTEKILSPTFVIEKIYKINHRGFEYLIHIDAYRLENPKELLGLGWDEIVKNPKNIICIEWASKVSELLPPDTISITFGHHSETSRTIDLHV